MSIKARDLLPPLHRGLSRWIPRLRGPGRTSPELEHFDGRFDIDWDRIHYNRIAVLNHINLRHGCKDYLEIGCRSNECFDSIVAESKIGVDPERGGTHRMTSDAFFAQCGERRFDTIFIDGDHTYDQVRRDLVNALQHLAVGGWLVLHDMFPREWQEAHVRQISKFWTGEVWKLGFDLIQSPDVDFRLLKIDHGVGVVRKVRAHVAIPDSSDLLREQSFRFFYENIDQLPVVDYADGKTWIENAPQIFDLPYSQDAADKLGMPEVDTELKEAVV
jgi:hypothetical protein